jgi:serine/threonine-protein kinase RsbW
MTNNMTALYRVNEKLKTDLKIVNPFLDRVSHELLPLIGSKDDIFKIKLALEEAVVNSMRHGNRLDDRCFVSVHIEVDAKKISMDVHDEGDGFDFRVLPDPTRGEKAHQPSGRGVYLMRKLMDKVEFYDGGSGVRMSKSLHIRP